MYMYIYNPYEYLQSGIYTGRHAWVCICMHIWVYEFMHLCMYVGRHAYIYLLQITYMHVYIHVYVCIYTYMYIGRHTWAYMCVFMWINIHMTDIHESICCMYAHLNIYLCNYMLLGCLGCKFKGAIINYLERKVKISAILPIFKFIYMFGTSLVTPVPNNMK